jgi:hypothetical protein
MAYKSLGKLTSVAFSPTAHSKTQGAAAGSGAVELATELQGAGCARVLLPQVDESGQAP